MATVAFVICWLGISLSSLLGLLITAFSIYLFYLHWRYSHIPGPKRDSFFFGNFALIQREREQGKILAEIFQELHSIHGPVVLIWALHNPVISVSDPEIARKLVVTLNLPKNPRIYGHLSYPFGQRLAGTGLIAQVDHDVWQKRRSLLNPAFHRRYLMNLMTAFNSSCDLFLAKMDELADGKTVVNMAEEFARVTLDVIGKVAFDVDVNVIRDANSPFPSAVSKGLKGIQESFRSPFWRVSISTFPFQRGVSEAAKFIRNFGRKVIQERQEAVLRGDDTPHDILAHILKEAEAEPSLTLEDLVDEFVTFFVAGNYCGVKKILETVIGIQEEKCQETTSNQLSFTLYEILKHPDVENRIVQEIEAVLGSRQFVEYKDLGNFQFLGQSLKEGLRLHPPIAGIARITAKGENIGGYFIPAGTSVSINWFIFHRLSEAWQEPEKFIPERFSPEVKSPIQQSVFFPFSLGPRNCIEQTFSQFGARVIMARLLQEFELTLLPGQNEIRHEARLTIRPKGGVLCTIKRRGENQK